MRLAAPFRALAILTILSGAPVRPCHAQWHVNGTPICAATGDQYVPQIASDGAGGAIVVWKDERGGLPVVYAQRLNAAGVPLWTQDGVLVSAPGSNTDFPVIAADGAGGALIAWKDVRGGSKYDIYAQRLNSLGQPQWTGGGAVVCDFTGPHEDPAITTDNAGGAIIAWADYRSDPETPDIYAQRVSAAGSALWTAQGVPVCTAAGVQISTQICSFPAGGAIVTWTDERGASTDVYAQRLNSAGETQWTANGVAMCTASGEQYGPQIVSDGSGGAVIAWYDYRGATADIYAQHAEGTGGAGWTSNGVVLCDAANDQGRVQAATDLAAGAIVTWSDERDATTTKGDIYAQRIRSGGTVDPAWTANGTLLCNADGSQVNAVIASDEAGGAIVAWQDLRSTTSFDIYAHHVLAAGTVDPAWTVNGQAVCTAQGDQGQPQIVGDGAGGAIVVWQDRRNGPLKVYAGHVTGAGIVAGVDPRDPPRFLRWSAHPNPSPGAIRIEWELRAPSRVTASVYDLSGRRVRTLVTAREDRSGRHGITWDGADDTGTRVESGIYLVRVRAGGESGTLRVAIVR